MPEQASHVYPFTLEALYIASHNRASDTYGIPYGLEADQIIEVDPQADTDMMRDSGQVTRGLTVVTHATITLTQGGMDFVALGILANGVSGQSQFKPEAGGDGLKYFGAIGVARLDGGEVMAIGLRSCKLDTIPPMKLDGQANKFNVSDMKGKAFAVGNRIYIFQRYASLSAWELARPTDGASLKTWLTA